MADAPTPAANPVVPAAPVAVPAATVPAPPAPPVTPTPAAAAPARDAAAANAERSARIARLRQDKENAERAARDASEYHRLQSLAKEDPLRYLEASGLTFEELANRVVAASADPEVVSLRRDVSSLREESQRRTAAEEQARVDAQARAWFDTARRQIEATEGDRFELLKGAGAEGTGLFEDAVAAYVREHQEAPDPLQVAEGVERYLEGLTRRLMGSRRFAPAPQDAAPADAAPADVATPKTLGSTLTPRTAVATKSRAERIAELKAIAKASGY
jgi:hypothetical protein